MPIIVHVWLPSLRKIRVGHGSMELSNGTYISWWPKGGKGIILNVTGTPNRTLEEDIEDEHGQPDVSVRIPYRVHLDQDAMQKWWDKFKASGKWNLFINCCWVVEEALKKGEIERYVKVPMTAFTHPIQLLALMMKIEAINVSTGISLTASIPEVFATALDNTISGILAGTSATDLVTTYKLR